MFSLKQFCRIFYKHIDITSPSCVHLVSFVQSAVWQLVLFNTPALKYWPSVRCILLTKCFSVHRPLIRKGLSWEYLIMTVNISHPSPRVPPSTHLMLWQYERFTDKRPSVTPRCIPGVCFHLCSCGWQAKVRSMRLAKMETEGWKVNY